MIAVIVFFAVIGYLLRLWGGGNNIVNFGSYLFLRLFDGISGNIFGILLYVCLLYTSFFRQFREHEPDGGSIVGRIDAQLGSLDGLLDCLYHRFLPWLDKNHARLRHGYVAHLLDRSRSPVIIYHNLIQYVGIGASRTDCCKVAFKACHRLLHLVFIYL